MHEDRGQYIEYLEECIPIEEAVRMSDGEWADRDDTEFNGIRDEYIMSDDVCDYSETTSQPLRQEWIVIMIDNTVEDSADPLVVTLYDGSYAHKNRHNVILLEDGTFASRDAGHCIQEVQPGIYRIES